MAGNVLRRLKGPGDKVMLGMDDPHSSHVVHLYDPGALQVRVDVPLADAAQVGVGQACEVVVDILPDEIFAGEVTRVTHEADLQKEHLGDPGAGAESLALAEARDAHAGEVSGSWSQRRGGE